MKQSLKGVLLAFSVAIAGLWCAGCSSTGVNPNTAQPGVGYVDFYCAENPSLAWDVDQITPGGAQKIFSEPNPVANGVLRLAFAPGNYHFEVSFLNQVISEQGTIELEVKQGLVTPVQAKLTPGGTSTVLEKETRTGSTYYGRAGRSTRITGNESNAYHVVLNQQAPLAYSRKELMPYAVKN
jgi:hypothetical protein